MTLALTLVSLVTAPYSAESGNGSESGRWPPATSAAALAEERGLVDRVREGDAEAFGTLMRRYFPKAVRFAAGFVRDTSDAEDIAQEVFSRLWTGRADWNPTVSVRAYVLGAVRHRAFNVIKHRSVETRYAESAAAVHDAQTEADAALALENATELTALRQAIHRLPERRRVALTLRYELGLSHAEVGETLGVSAKAAKELLARTLEVLHTRLNRLR